MGNGGPNHEHEYTNVHNERIARVRIMHLWQQIAFPAAAIIFGFFAQRSVSNNGHMLLVLGGLLAILVVISARVYAHKLDSYIVDLYPQIVFLELKLKYTFFRNYLRRQKHGTFVRVCEAEFDAANDDCYQKMLAARDEESFSPWKRGHKFFDIVAGIMIAAFVLACWLLW